MLVQGILCCSIFSDTEKKFKAFEDVVSACAEKGQLEALHQPEAGDACFVRASGAALAGSRRPML